MLGHMNVTSAGPPIVASRWQVPRLDKDDRWVGGVAAAIAREVGVQPIVIRAAFVAVTFVGGWGLVLYGFAWVALALVSNRRQGPYAPHPKAATSTHRVVAVALITLGLIIGLLPLTGSGFAIAVWPVGFVLSGMLIAWTRSGDDGSIVVVRVVAGIVVAIAGFAMFAFSRVDVADAVLALVALITVVGGVAIVAAPSVVRMSRDLDRERLERTRSDERAQINAHLHDSVLQTLTLIQQQADDPSSTRRLARRQERELRGWLYNRPMADQAGNRLRPALERAATDVEQHADVVFDIVVVGDTDDLEPDRVAPLIDATREAMFNAAVHSGAEQVSVFADRTPGGVEVFVRDEGSGFDPSTIADDRRGISESIVGRMRRAGGDATITSAPGVGTEVELSLPVEASTAREVTR